MGLSLGATSHHGAGVGRALAAPLCLRHLSAVCNHEDSEMYLLEKEVYEKCCTDILSCE